MSYAGMNRTDAAAAMGTTPGTLDRITGRKGGETKLATWQQLWQLAERAGLPTEWFAADFDRMREIVPPGLPVVTPGSVGAGVDDTAAREAIAAAEAGPAVRRRSVARGSARASRAR